MKTGFLLTSLLTFVLGFVAVSVEAKSPTPKPSPTPQCRDAKNCPELPEPARDRSRRE